MTSLILPLYLLAGSFRRWWQFRALRGSLTRRGIVSLYEAERIVGGR